jgi:arabinofuranan 3-O-arabinosyltransferase
VTATDPASTPAPDVQPEPAPRPVGLVDRAITAAQRPVALVGLFAVLAAVAVTTSAPGRYVGENRVDQYLAPGHRLVRTLWLWDPTRGLGRPREDLWPLQIGPLAALRGLGVPEVAAQRIFHALLLVVAAAGAAAVLRHVRNEGDAADADAEAEAEADADGERAGAGGLAPLLAGLLYGFGPYAITFLTPANLFAAYAVAPWVVLCALRGSGSARPWRWAAAAALIVGGLGNADYPGVVLSLVGIPVVAVWAAHRRGRGVGAALGWLARAAGLTVVVSAAALWKTVTASAVFAQRVSTTESPETVGVASSWSETWRGLGFWLSYFRTDVLARPQTADYFTDPTVALVTFVPAVVALAALALREVRGRVLFGVIAVGSAALMVGIHPVGDKVPLGRFVLRVLDASAATSGFRTTYKAGAGLVLGVAVLSALAAEALARRAGRRGQGRVLVGAVAVVVVVVASLPAWTGDLYDASRTSGPVPDYWQDAARTINQLPGRGRLLVLPASTRTVYDWGWVGDDILDSLITRPHAVDTAVPLSGPEAADVLADVSQAAGDARHRPGAVAAVLRRLGIDHVLLRNDVDADATRTLAPDALAQLRADPGLDLVGTFGDLPVTVTATPEGGDTGARQPLELFAVTDPGDLGPRVAPADGQLVVSGSGDAMVALGADGDLGSSGPVRFSGALDAAEAAAALDDDGRLVLSDTNRRRVTVVNALVRGESWTLAAGEDLDREADAPYDAPGSQTVAWYHDATRITSDGAPRGGRGAQSWTRPAAAFDANSATWWQTVETADQEGIRLRVALREPQALTRVRIEPLDAPRTARRLTEVVVRTSDGSETTLDVGEGGTEVDVATGPSDWVEIEITGVSDGADRPVGIREVELDGADGPLDLREWITLPDDLVRRAEGDERLAAALEAAPVSVLMAPDQPEAPFPVEPVLRRRVRLPHAIEASVTATVRPADPAAADLLGTLVDGACNDEILRIDGEPLGLTLSDDQAEIEVGEPARLRSCDPVFPTLDAGWHQVETRSGASLASVRIDGEHAAPPSGDVPPDDTGAVAVREETPDRMRLTVDAPDGGVVLTGQSYDVRWVATVDGESLGPAGLYDGQSGWELPAGTDLDVVVELRPARRYRVASWISVVGVVTCLVLVAGRRRRQGPGVRSTSAA